MIPFLGNLASLMHTFSAAGASGAAGVGGLDIATLAQLFQTLQPAQQQGQGQVIQPQLSQGGGFQPGPTALAITSNQPTSLGGPLSLAVRPPRLTSDMFRRDRNVPGGI